MRKSIFRKPALLLALLAATAFQLHAQTDVRLSPKVFLKGPLQPNGLMRDDLRAKGYLPASEPYSALANFQHYGDGGGEAISGPGVFSVTGPNAIVDWVVVELRSASQLSTPIATHAALLQRDGDVVNVDGVSPVRFLTVAPGAYHVSVRHRNHLGVMSAAALNLTNDAILVDFSDPALPLFGTNACAVNGNIRALWLGDSNRDKKVIYQGPNNDTFSLFSAVMSAPGNVNLHQNYIVTGYSLADNNLDGNTIFNGPNNDRNFTFFQAGLGFGALNYILTEQVP